MESEIAQLTAEVIITDYVDNIKEFAEEARKVAIEEFEKLLEKLRLNSVGNKFSGYEVVYRPLRGERIYLPEFKTRITLPRFYVTIDGDTNGYNLYAILDEGRKAIPVPAGKFVPFSPLRVSGVGTSASLYPMTQENSLETRGPKRVVKGGVRGPKTIAPIHPRNFTELITDKVNEELRSRDNPIQFEINRTDNA